MKNDWGRRWYLTALAAIYLTLCSVGCVYYVAMQFRSSAGSVPALQQVLCLAFAIAAGMYFLRARIGHIALTALTVLTLAATGTSNPGATVFHLCVLLVLLLPFVRKQNPSANKALGV